MKRLFEIIQIGEGKDIPSRLFDYFITVCILSNITSMILLTFGSLNEYHTALSLVEQITTYIFIVEYILRVATAKYLHPTFKTRTAAIILFVFSTYGIIDLLSILPVILNGILPYGFSVLRMLRVFRILKLFQITKNYDSFSVISTVIKSKRKQISSSVFIIVTLMLSASVVMYGFEHDAQPDKFENALSGVWWSVNTMLTVGYGDIYPITVGGKILTILLEFLGVGLVAIPTGILSAGFMEYHSKPTIKDIDRVVSEMQVIIDSSENKKFAIDLMIDKMKNLKV